MCDTVGHLPSPGPTQTLPRPNTAQPRTLQIHVPHIHARHIDGIAATGAARHDRTMATLPRLRRFAPLAPLARLAPLALLAATPFAIAPDAASANDSEAEWAIGGIELRANPDISMDSEELFISEDAVRVDYVYTNHAAEPRTVTIAFPLPALPRPGEYEESGSYPDWDAFGFATTVDGAPIAFTQEDRAVIGGRDVTAAVLAEGMPIHWYGDDAFIDALDTLPPERVAALVKAGLFHDENAGQEGLDPWYRPAWQGERVYLRTQTFPAGAQVRVSHRYRPAAGGSVGGALTPEARADKEWNPLAQYRAQYCVDDSFLAGIDRKLARGTEANPVYMSETWLGYVLSSGANWRGPIRHFRLVVDKGAADNLVSFCMDGVKKISPTRFEVVKENFEPEADLAVLIVKFVRPNEE